MKMILFFMLAIGCMPALIHAYKIELTNRSPFKIEMVCDLIAGPTKKTTIKPYKSGTINTVGWLMRKIHFTVINPKNGITYGKFFHEQFGRESRIGNKSFTIAAEPYVEKDGSVTQVKLYLLDLNFSHIEGNVITSPVIQGGHALPL